MSGLPRFESSDAARRREVHASFEFAHGRTSQSEKQLGCITNVHPLTVKEAKRSIPKLQRVRSNLRSNAFETFPIVEIWGLANFYLQLAGEKLCFHDLLRAWYSVSFR